MLTFVYNVIQCKPCVLLSCMRLDHPNALGSMIRTRCLLLRVHDTWLLHTLWGTYPSLGSYGFYEIWVLYDYTLCIPVIELLGEFLSRRLTLRDEFAYVKDTCFICLSWFVQEWFCHGHMFLTVSSWGKLLCNVELACLYTCRILLMYDYSHLWFTRLARTIALNCDAWTHLIVQYILVLFCLVVDMRVPLLMFRDNALRNGILMKYHMHINVYLLVHLTVSQKWYMQCLCGYIVQKIELVIFLHFALGTPWHGCWVVRTLRRYFAWGFGKRTMCPYFMK
jgi:hypothetical protein